MCWLGSVGQSFCTWCQLGSSMWVHLARNSARVGTSKRAALIFGTSAGVAGMAGGCLGFSLSTSFLITHSSNPSSFLWHLDTKRMRKEDASPSQILTSVVSENHFHVIHWSKQVIRSSLIYEMGNQMPLLDGKSSLRWKDGKNFWWTALHTIYCTLPFTSFTHYK